MITKELFGMMPCGCRVDAYTLKNSSGASVKVLNLGGIIVSINVPDKNGVLADVVCGYDDVNSYLTNSGYQGALIVRYGYRIGDSSFAIDDKQYTLFNNEGKNHLHGGKIGFDKKLWEANTWECEGSMYIELSLFSPDGEEGYPGNLNVKVLYSFDENNTLTINYKATTDKKTVINLTNHAYFNLAGYDTKSIKNHSLWINSDKITVVNEKALTLSK